ncbi:MAG: hypothetical protein WC043_04270 [Pseudobdellovibrionaceae bacterium]
MSIFAPSKKDSFLAPEDNLKNDNTENKLEDTPPVATQIFIGKNPPLRNWKMGGEIPQDQLQAEEGAPSFTKESPADLIARRERTLGERRIATARPVSPMWLQVGQAVAVFLTVAWISYASIYILALPGGVKSIISSPLTLGGILASVLAPVAMLWLCIATWQRRSDAHLYALALKDELRGLLFPTEEQSRLISDDLKMLMKQAAEMSASSRASIKAIQRARAGLRTEIRDFSGVSQKAEFHIDRLADELSKRAEELISLTETIEKQTDTISSKAQRGVSAWETVSAEISELTDEVDHIFTQGTSKLESASQTAAAKIQSLEDTMLKAADTLSERIGQVAGAVDLSRTKLDDQALRLEQVSEDIANGAHQLESSLAGAEKVSSATQSVLNLMTESLRHVEETAEGMFERTENIGETIKDRTSALQETAEKFVESHEKLQASGDAATHKLGEALSMALSGAEAITSAVRRSKEMIDRSVQEASHHIEGTTRVAGESLGDLLKRSDSSQKAIAATVEAIAQQNSELAGVLHDLELTKTSVVKSVSGVTDTLQEGVMQMAAKFAEPVEHLENALEALEDKATQLDDRMAVRTAEIRQGADKLQTTAHTIEQSLEESISSFREAVESVSVHTRQIDEDVQHHRTELTALVGDLEGKTKSVEGFVTEKTRHLLASVSEVDSQIESLGDKISGQGEIMLEGIVAMAEHIKRHEEGFMTSLDKMTTHTDVSEGMLKANVAVITDLASSIVPSCDAMIAKADELSGRYDKLKNGYEMTTETVLSCLNQVGDNLDLRIEKLGAGTMDTSRLFLSVAEDLSGAMTDIRKVSEDAQERMTQIQSGVKGRIDDLQLVTDQVKVKVDVMQQDLGLYIAKLDTIVKHAVENLQSATDRFGDSATLLDSKAGEATARLLDASAAYANEGSSLQKFGETAAVRTVEIISAVQEESAKLVQATRHSLGELQKSGDTIAVRAREVEEYMRASISNAKSYSDELKAQAMDVADQSAEAVEKISDATARLAANAQNVVSLGGVVSEGVDVARIKLSEESGRLALVAKKTIEAADEAGNIFARHTSNLYKAVEDMAEQAKKVRDSQLRMEREHFLTSAKFVIESLYSLSVDVARHLDDDMDTRVMKAYQRGDVAAFTRHLIELAPRIPAEKCQKKFIEDSEFRTYVLRFIRQFEELLEQSHANDYADLLSSVFSTSDIGKLYLMLCAIAGRNAKIH